MLAVSTIWSFTRHGALGPAVDAIAALGFEAAELRANGAVPDHVDGARHAAEIRMKCPSVFAPLDPRPWAAGDPTLGLASTDEARRRAAVNAALTTLPAAAAARAEVISLRLGPVEIRGADADRPDLERRRAVRDRHLDAAARSLFELRRAESGVVWSIVTPRTWLELPDPEEVELLVSDAGGRNVAYTHDVAAAARLGAAGVADPQVWLERCGSVTSGVVFSDIVSSDSVSNDSVSNDSVSNDSVSNDTVFSDAVSNDTVFSGVVFSDAVSNDPAGDVDGLPPGAGTVDWPAVAAQVGSGMLRTLLVDARHSAAELVAGADHLRGLGLA